MSKTCPRLGHGWDRRLVVRVLTFGIAVLLVAENLQADLNITRVDFGGGQLRIEGDGAVGGAVMTLDGEAVADARDDGRFRIELQDFTPEFSEVIVSDGVCPTFVTLPGVDPPPEPAPEPAPSGDFTLGTNFGGTGHLVRGGLTDCLLCTSLDGPQYIVVSGFGCFYGTDTIGMVSLNDFEGPVTLEFLNLPAGVTSQTQSPATIPRGGAEVIPIRLSASTTAALGTATVTLVATAGSIVHTIDLPISVADALPPLPCDEPPTISITSPADGAPVSGVVQFAAQFNDNDGLVVQVNWGVRLVGGPAQSATTVGSTVVNAASGTATFNWDSTAFADGTWEIWATAVDDATPDANFVTAPFVDMIVTNGPAPEPGPVPEPDPTPTADVVSILRAQYDGGKNELRVEASSSSAGALLAVFDTLTGDMIGTLDSRGRGRLSWPVNPEVITVMSDLGGEDTASVEAK